MQLPDTAPRFETEDLILDASTAQDVQPIAAILSASDVYCKNTESIPYPYTVDDAQEFIRQSQDGLKENTSIGWAVRLKAERGAQLIGAIGFRIFAPKNFRAELGYWIDERHWGKGYTTQAAKTVIEWAFSQTSIHGIDAGHYPHNPSSGSVLKKCGFTYSGTLPQYKYKDGQYYDCLLYSLINTK